MTLKTSVTWNTLRAALIVLLSTGVCLTVHAGESPTHGAGVYMGGGITLPTGDLGNKMGFHAQIRPAIPLCSRAELVPAFEYHSFGESNSSLISFSGGIKFSPIPRVLAIKPFLLADGGAAKPKGGQVVPAFGAGVGLDIISKSTSVISLSIRYVNVFDDGRNVSFVPITLTLKGGS